MFGSIILFFVGVAIGMYLVSQIKSHINNNNNKLLDNLNKWESSHKVNYKWREDEKRNPQK